MLFAICAIAASAIAFYFCTGFNHVWWAAWIAPIPVLALAFRSSGRVARVASFLAYLLGISHIATYVSLFSGWPFTIAALLVMAFIFQLCVGFARSAALRLPGLAAVWAFPVAWTTYEFLLALLGPYGTVLNYAYSQLGFPPILQVASVTGIWGISFTLMLFASFVAILRKQAWPAGVLVLAVLLFGVLRLKQASGPAVQVGLIAADAAIAKSWRTKDPQQAVAIADAWAGRITKVAAEGARVIVLPEKALAITPADQQQVYHKYSEAARMTRTTVVAGFNFVAIDPPRNMAVVFGPDGQIEGTYDKHHMLPGPETGYLIG